MKKMILHSLILLASVSLLNISCKKALDQIGDILDDYNSNSGHIKQTKTFSSDVVTKWLDMQLNLLRVPLATGATSAAAERAQGYSGVVAYEAVVPGMPSYQSLQGQLVDMPAMPATEPGKAYHWAASENAALAQINRKLFPGASADNKAAIDALENTLLEQYKTEVDASTIARSVAFGKAVADKIYEWASTEVTANNCVYVDPTPEELLANPALWVRTSPAAPPVNPCAKYTRLFVNGADEGTTLAPPPPYSTEPGSPFYEMVKDVYDKQNNATEDQKASAYYYRDAPGYPGGGAFVAIYSQLLAKAQPMLDVAALGYAKVGIAQHDATIVCFTQKYYWLLVRPVTYIKQYIDPAWGTYIPTPNHPEFPSGHATINSAVTTMYADVFGENFGITLHTYDYLTPALPARSFTSFEQMSKEMADSRVFGGLHYQATCEKSRVQGKKVATNVLAKLKFKK